MRSRTINTGLCCGQPVLDGVAGFRKITGWGRFFQPQKFAVLIDRYLHRSFNSLLIFLSLLCLCPAMAEDQFLPPEQAFRFSAKMIDASAIEVRFDIADDYYLYRERFVFKADGAQLGTPIIPAGKMKFDETFGKTVETYRQQVLVRLPVKADTPFTLSVSSQGCSDRGLCYAPMESTAKLTPAALALSATRDTPPAPVTVTANTDMGRIEASLASGNLLLILPLFLLLGLGLSLTPCVLPMVPILSFIIVGEGAGTSRGRGFVLSLAYAMGMALVYTGLGIAAGLIGEGLSASLQSPPVLIAFAVFMALLSLSMFDVYQLQVPSSLQLKLTRWSERQRAGKLAGVFVMGMLSALIVGPCVAAPLAGVLVYISQTRDVVIGGSALFAMAMGMSVPLLLLGLSAGTLVPRAGHWMQAVKPFFGVLMLALALWMVASLVPASVLMLGWGLLGVGYGVFLFLSRQLGWRGRAIGVVFVLLGAVQLVGLATGGRDAWAPLAHLSGKTHDKIAFKRVHSIAELDQTIAAARGRPVMLDFYADWCVACVEMEKLTFTDPAVSAKMQDVLLLQVDVTANNLDDKALLKRFSLFGPPGIIFFGRDGEELQKPRVIGFQPPAVFLQSLEQLDAH
jgi:thiol:disulfide interchange protein DsbD